MYDGTGVETKDMSENDWLRLSSYQQLTSLPRCKEDTQQETQEGHFQLPLQQNCSSNLDVISFSLF